MNTYVKLFLTIIFFLDLFENCIFSPLTIYKKKDMESKIGDGKSTEILIKTSLFPFIRK